MKILATILFLSCFGMAEAAQVAICRSTNQFRAADDANQFQLLKKSQAVWEALPTDISLALAETYIRVLDLGDEPANPAIVDGVELLKTNRADCVLLTRAVLDDSCESLVKLSQRIGTSVCDTLLGLENTALEVFRNRKKGTASCEHPNGEARVIVKCP